MGFRAGSVGSGNQHGFFVAFEGIHAGEEANATEHLRPMGEPGIPGDSLFYDGCGVAVDTRGPIGFSHPTPHENNIRGCRRERLSEYTIQS